MDEWGQRLRDACSTAGEQPGEQHRATAGRTRGPSEVTPSRGRPDSSRCGRTVHSVGECGLRLAADDRGGLLNQFVVLDGLHHEAGEVHPTCQVALKDRVSYVS